ncbi:MAG: TPM domain-containing protein [Ruminococcaceae bacterium]|nr:TPM domain-containing protein [Oscillospiraceae bacterium]
MKHLLSLCLALILLLSLSFQVSAANDTLVHDRADLLSKQEESDLEEELLRVSQLHGIQLAVATVDSLKGMNVDEYIEYYYDNNDFGYDSDRRGVLLLVSMGTREYRILSNGRAGDIISVEDIDRIGEEIVPDLSSGSYADAFMKFAAQCNRYLTPSTESPDPDSLLFDSSDLLTTGEETALADELQRISDQHGVQVIVSIVDFIDSSDIEYDIDSYYESCGFGYGADHAGILLLVCTESREYQIYAHGSASNALRESETQYIGAQIVPLLASERYTEAFAKYAAMCDEQLSAFADHSADSEMLLCDDADLLTTQQEAAVLEELRFNSKKYDAQFLIYTVDSMEGMTADEYVEHLYDSNSFGYGEERDGVLLLVCMDAREFRILSNGWPAGGVNGGAIEYISDEIGPYLTDGAYDAAFLEFLSECTYWMDYFSPNDYYYNSKSWARWLYDDADLLTDEEEVALCDELIYENLNEDAQIIIATVDSLGGVPIDDYVADYYDTMGFGFGTSRDGVLLLVCGETREYRILAKGEATETIDEETVGEIMDYIGASISNGNYYNAFDGFRWKVGNELSSYGQDDYDFDSGDIDAKGVFFVLMLALSPATIITACMKSQLKSVRKAPHANVYTKKGSMHLTGQSDIYLYKTVRSVKVESDSGSGSGRSRSSGGGSRSIGGGRF